MAVNRQSPMSAAIGMGPCRWVSTVRLVWCRTQPLARSWTPGAPEMTTTGTRSA